MHPASTALVLLCLILSKTTGNPEEHEDKTNNSTVDSLSIKPNKLQFFHFEILTLTCDFDGTIRRNTSSNTSQPCKDLRVGIQSLRCCGWTVRDTSSLLDLQRQSEVLMTSILSAAESLWTRDMEKDSPVESNRPSSTRPERLTYKFQLLSPGSSLLLAGIRF
ncbi:hypothetical protein Q5P01_002858 [Channa striata]|uniref:Uncharacterized protein n=1 Tax=Channa striata TaxID=64152 RepID=A0AA88NRU3_CHASR|nr:hypothetical protein Q5P01_002858 [Channa striata]